MRLPNADQASITESKVRDYLLNPLHPNNGGKWRLFQGLGYTSEDWHQFATDIREQHLILDAVEVEANAYARRLRIDGELQGPNGSARIRTTWAIPYETGIPHLTSAYGAKRAT